MNAIKGFARALRRRREQHFDLTFGVETAETDLADNSAVAARWPSPISLFKRIIRRSGVSVRDFCFVDLGCGKGRALLLAAELGFQKVVGVEKDVELFEIARANIKEWKKPRRGNNVVIDILNEDAETFIFPDGNIFVYLYDPFDRATFEAIATTMSKLAFERNRSVVVAYNSARFADILGDKMVFTRRDMWPRLFWRKSTVSFFYNSTPLGTGS